MEGTTLADRYRISSRIGDGGLATVYRATDLRLDRTVAVKILKPQWAGDPEALERFRREARTAAKLTHPNIVQVLDTGVEGDVHFLVMEYLPEHNLKQIIAEYAPLPPRKVLQVAISCCQALAEIHRRGLVHGDVKPQNILFTSQGEPKLSDFGISTAVGQTGEGPTGMVMGTAHYISPEQAQGRAIGPQSDLYSLGCVIYETLTGYPPFSGETAAQVAAKHVRQQPPSPRALNPTISPSQEYLLNKAMAKDPARRYRTAEEMRTDLEKLASGAELDRTGVLSAEDATAPMQPTPSLAEPGQAADTTLIWHTAAVIGLALVALVMAGWLIKQAFYPGAPPAEVQVPSVRGLTEAEARQKLTDAKLVVGVVRTIQEADKPVGQVTEQHPTEGESVPVGTKVELTVNLGKETVTVPDLTGMLVQRAADKLEQIGLTVGETTERYSDEFEEDKVIRQSHAPGTVVEKGWPIPLIISKGPEPAEEEQPVEPLQPSEEEPQPLEPDVTIRVDEASTSADGITRDYIVNITVFGQKEDQHIKVIKRDAQGGPIVVLDEEMEPGRARQLRITGRGNTTIEVYHEGKPIARKNFKVETPSGNNTQ
ncbi:MAG: Stk1 family PASTA domain-containing Ser/Thr kinase [Armatimonadetes bacterium]|nr:Stk1 family PASTA domain-containing Ser/Thr kinase [Armatimonadota bacterium]